MCAKVLWAKSNAVITRRESRIRLDTDASVVRAPGYRLVGARDRRVSLRPGTPYQSKFFVRPQLRRLRDSLRSIYGTYPTD